MTRVHAFGDDALGDLDAVALVEALQSGDVSVREVVEAAIARVERVDPDAQRGRVHAPSTAARGRGPRARAAATSPAYPRSSRTTSTSPACPPARAPTPGWATPAASDGDFARMYLATGLIPLGKSQLSEYGFSASAEHPRLGPVRNPWSTRPHRWRELVGGSAALVAAGAVPIAHANDGGGSIRIPASVNGLVGLKPTRGRLAQDKAMRDMPVRIVSDGVVTRSVRDTAAFFREAEKVYRCAEAAADRRHHPARPQAAPGRRQHHRARAGARRPRSPSSPSRPRASGGARPHGRRGRRARCRTRSPTTSCSTGRRWPCS